MGNTTIGGSMEFLFGYAKGEQYLVTNTVEQICAFIMKFRFDNVKLVNAFDVLEIETSGGIISFCGNQRFLGDELIPVLAPMQMGKVESPEFISHAIGEEFVDDEEGTDMK